MRRVAAMLLVFCLLIICTPMLAMRRGDLSAEGGRAPSAPSPAAAEQGQVSDESGDKQLLGEGESVADAPSQTNKDSPAAAVGIAVLDEGTGQLLALTMRDYLIGALMSEMPMTYNKEALKAQVIATHSFALYTAEFRSSHPDSSLKGGIFSVNTAKNEGYITEQNAKIRFGSSYQGNRLIAETAVDEVIDLILTYGGRPAACCYFAQSAGVTEFSENVFASPLPYLVSVDSHWDRDVDGCRSEKTVSYSEFSEKLAAANSSFSPLADPSKWLGSIERTAAGTVKSVEICGVSFKGAQIRSLFSLKSANFEITLTDDGVKFTVFGHGHQVGLSQTGANAMAAEGAAAAEILAHYYPETELLSASDLAA